MPITTFSSATALLADRRSGAMDATTITRQCLKRIKEREPAVQAWAHLDPPLAVSNAQAIDAMAQASDALSGIPIGIKDVILTRDMPTRYNCDLYADNEPHVDAGCVSILRGAGAVILGKTQTVELASIGRAPPTRNPHALDHTPGGSSSGSAAAVADGHVPLAIGTQTGGSIIRPASFCGVWALKPTWGIVGTDGVKPFAPSLDTLGWFARDVDDLSLLLDIFDPPFPSEEATASEKLRIAIWRTAGWPQAEEPTRTAMDHAIAVMRASGAEIEELAPPKEFEDLARVQWAIMFAEGGRSFLPEFRKDADRLHPSIANMVRDVRNITQSDLRAAYDAAADARRIFDHLTAGYDAVLMPSTISHAPRGLEHTGNLLFNGLLTLLHVPCVNMPLFKAANGLPVGLTMAGGRFRDRRVIAAARTVASYVSNKHII